MNSTEKKITLATLKSFARKNSGRLLIRVRSSFDGMTDCIQNTGSKTFSPVQPATYPHAESNLGLQGVWLVGGSRNHFTAFADEQHEGIACSNCCGSFVLAVAAQKGGTS